MSASEPALAGEDSVRPIVAATRSNRGLWLFGGGLAIAALLLFRGLEARRETLVAPPITAPADATAGIIAPPPGFDLPPGYAGAYPPDLSYPFAPSAARPSPVAPPPSRQPSAPRASASVDYAPLPSQPPSVQEIVAAQTPYQPATPPAVPEPPALDGSASGSGGKERVEAARFANPATTIPKGTVIQAVLETALDSNRAGFARAIVSRDVLGFDGSKVLVPRGSRIIGEYKSDVTLGQNRVLIQWQRLMRPDGVMITMDSPSADPLGRAGIRGKVNSHFFERFAGAILQSALDVGTQLATREVARDAIYIGLPGLTQSLAIQPEKIQPTVRVRQGRSVSVFVARDLDFTKGEPVTDQLENFYLSSCLAPLAAHLARRDITDIYINRPGEIWLETLGHAPVRHAAPDVTNQLLARLARQVAAASAQGISRENPLLAARLPSGERIQIAMPPATRGDIAVAIRKHVASGFSLEDYAGEGAASAAEIGAERREWEGAPIAADADGVDILRRAVRDRRNILISGGTSSGKTTFLNALLREIPSDERLIVIEDTPELQLVHENAVGLIAARGGLSEADVTAEDLLIASLRMRPDRIILGEIRGKEAVTFLRAVNTGHPGSLSTIHADSPARALDQLALLVLQTGTRMSWDDVLRYVRQSIDIIVQLGRGSGKRGIVKIAATREMAI